MEDMTNKKEKLFNLLYEWTIEENCDYCRHLASFRDGDNRHPCNRCECYELFKLSDVHKVPPHPAGFPESAGTG